LILFTDLFLKFLFLLFQYFSLPHDDLTHLNLFVFVHKFLTFIHKVAQNLTVVNLLSETLFIDIDELAIFFTEEDMFLWIESPCNWFIWIPWGSCFIFWNFSDHSVKSNIHCLWGIRDASGSLCYKINCAFYRRPN